MRRTIAVLLLFGTSIAGVAWRHLPLGLPWFAFKYGGSALWAVALYWLCAAVWPRWDSRRLVPLTAAIALIVELSRLVHIFPALDAFRLTLPGRLLLGRFFSVKNILAYWLAITLTAFVDDRWIDRRE